MLRIVPVFSRRAPSGIDHIPSAGFLMIDYLLQRSYSSSR
jgi:hypothetical protein